MHIDPFILAAQIINFLVLVYLLKRFLYDRIVETMNIRENGIADRMSEIERLKDEALASVATCEARKHDIEDRADEMLNQAKLAAEKEKVRLMEQMREEVARAQQRWLETLDQEKAAFLDDLRKRAGTYVFETIRQILADLADEELENRIVQSFVRRLSSLEPQEKALLKKVLDMPEPVIRVKSSFELDERLKQPIEEVLQPLLGPGGEIVYELNGHTGAGIELMAHGYKLSWSIDDYLQTLQEKFLQLL
jgi:F-type H+-transporting ATPase subunit b